MSGLGAYECDTCMERTCIHCILCPCRKADIPHLAYIECLFVGVVCVCVTLHTQTIVVT